MGVAHDNLIASDLRAALQVPPSPMRRNEMSFRRALVAGIAVVMATAAAKPPNTNDYPGPVNDMVLVVPTTSTQKGISAEEAYLIFGEGAAGMVMPWIDPTKYFIRTSDSGTRAMIAANIGTGSHAWQG